MTQPNTIIIHMAMGFNFEPQELKRLQRDMMDLVPIPKRRSFSLTASQGIIEDKRDKNRFQSIDNFSNPIEIERVHGTDMMSFGHAIKEED
ncbi:hypothetical protein LCGC14_2001390 [marine sediment metagenome]|uniref:Uncharacterized protein n=1 Tax=marine sediment metagenome TaxID=412755 RepID=A0A0F9FQU5_9ZZZZ